MTHLYRGILGIANRKWQDDLPVGSGAKFVERRMKQVADDANVAFDDDFLFRAQYNALEKVAQQYDTTARNFVADGRIQIDDGCVQSLCMVGRDVTTPDRTLRLPYALTRLQSLNCAGTSLKALYLPPTLTHLQELCCGNNALKSLDIPDTLTRLRRLLCDHNRLTALYLPPTLAQLEELSCNKNRLQSLQIPGTFTHLQILKCSDNALTALDIAPNLRQLVEIHCSDNKLTSLQLPSRLKRLEWINCSNNPLDMNTWAVLEELEDRDVHVVY
jgi:hypothetical protein